MAGEIVNSKFSTSTLWQVKQEVLQKPQALCETVGAPEGGIDSVGANPIQRVHCSAI